MYDSNLLGCGSVDGQAVPDVSKEGVVLTLNHFSEDQNPQMQEMQYTIPNSIIEYSNTVLHSLRLTRTVG
jgi:hypothetical protein